MPALQIPPSTFDLELVPGGVKKIKSENRRSDAMSMLAPEKISVLPNFNVRVRTPDYLEHLREIVDSMKADGFQIDQALSVYVARESDDDVVYVVDGHTRLEAAKIAIAEGAEFTEIPVILLPKSLNMVDMTVALKRSNTVRPLTPYETALVAKRLDMMDLSEAEIGRKLGLNPSYVNGLLLLAAAPRAVANMVIANELSAAEAINVLRKHGNKAVEVLAKAKQKAGEAGRSRVTASHMPGAALNKAIRKSAPRLFATARQITEDPGYASLRTETRTQLDELLAELKKMEDAGQAAATAE
ncbi:ParB/RepB/Spo0J family partition protein [Rhodanobacter sp. 115]|uniref:ParB/RepB/Spo0J family partition protein n=1 Tax=Rhodanobacter sp. FW021-MT20 TaxID=1162282 RepID=UPI0034E5F5EC